jgi:hypothetical protein
MVQCSIGGGWVCGCVDNIVEPTLTYKKEKTAFVIVLK